MQERKVHIGESRIVSVGHRIVAKGTQQVGKRVVGAEAGEQLLHRMLHCPRRIQPPIVAWLQTRRGASLFDHQTVETPSIGDTTPELERLTLAAQVQNNGTIGGQALDVVEGFLQ